jgi:hypothetical protein
MISNSDFWNPMEDMPPVNEETRVRYFQVLLDIPHLGSRIHTASFSLTANKKTMVIVGGNFLWDLEGKMIRWRDLPEIPEGM